MEALLRGHEAVLREPLDGVVYVVSGGGAGTRRTGAAAFTAVSFSWHHFLDISVFPDHLVLRAVNQDQRVADELVLHAGA